MNRTVRTHRAKRPTRMLPLLPALAMVFAAFSSSGAGANAAPGPSTSSPTYVAAALPNRLTSAPVGDPTLDDMTAVTMMIPEGWKLQGLQLMQPCTAAPSPAFRATSRDGLMQIRQEPLVGWNWGMYGSGPQGCLSFPGTLSAADFRKYYVQTMRGGVHIVGPMPVVASYAQASKKLAAAYEASGARMGPRFRLEHASDTAALRIQTVNGSFVVEQRLRAEVQCGVTSPDAPSKGGTCYARVDVLAAPLGKLDALVRFADANALPRWTTNPTWFKASIAQLKDRLEREGAQRLADGRAQSQAFSQMMYGAFQQNMARSASEHAAFMRQQESSFRSSMNAANAAMNARSTAASDWVDYALDQQTVTGTGGTTKISSAYSQTWSNGHGGWYQTNDATNPNGILQGNWTKATVVHGNGQP